MTLVPRNLTDYLIKVIPGFDRELKKFEVTKMLWMYIDPNRRHLKYENSINLSSVELVQLFGRSPSFEDINRGGFRYFRVHRFLNGKDAQGRTYNNGYEPWPWMLNALVEFLSLPSTPTKLLNNSGKVINKAPNSIDGKTKNGHSAHGWRDVYVPSLIQVNVCNLERIKSYYLQNEKVQNDVERNRNFNRFLTTASLLTQANSNFQDSLIHRYVQSQSGRLYAEGLNLQNCPKEIRNAALAGCWDYDINCCHFSILQQMAEKLGFNCPIIKEYVENKTVFRGAIAHGAGISIAQAKLVLTATIYGARKGLQLSNAIPRAIGIASSDKLYQLDAYKAITSEITRAKKVVLERYPHPNGRYVNLFKMAISNKEKVASKLSHLMEGVEAAALRSAVGFLKDEIVLLQHDGFVTKRPIDINALERKVFQDTGYKFTYEEREISYPIQKEFVNSEADDTELKLDKIFNENNGLEDKIDSPLLTMASYACDIPPVYPDVWISETLF